MTDRQDFNYVKAPLNHLHSSSSLVTDPLENYKDSAADMSSEILLEKKREELMIIDQYLGRDYLWYLIWLSVDFALNIFWLLFLFLKELSYLKDATVAISLCVTVLLLAVICYGALAFLTKDSKRQMRFTNVLRALIFICLVDIPVLIFAESPVLLSTRILGTGICVAVFYTARNLDAIFEKRTKIIQNLSVATEI